MSAEWAAYTRDRVQRWRAQREELVRVHRQDTYARLLDFYEKVDIPISFRLLGYLIGFLVMVCSPPHLFSF